MLHFSEIEEICKRTKLKLDPDGRQFTSSRKAMRRGDQKTIEEHRPLFIAALALGTSGLLETTRREIVHNGQYLGYANCFQLDKSQWAASDYKSHLDALRRVTELPDMEAEPSEAVRKEIEANGSDKSQATD